MTRLTTITREIEYDRASRDFCATVEGNIIGNYGSFLQAEEACDEYVYEMLMHQPIDAICDTPPGEPVPPPEPTCKRDVLGERWTVCHAPGDGPCMCDVIVCAGAEPEPGIDPGDHGGGPRLACPSCEAPTRHTLHVLGARAEATATLYDEDGWLLAPTAVALAVAGPAERFIRTPEHDRRIGRGDDFNGDAWRDRRTSEIRYTVVGHNPNGKIGGSEVDPDLALAVAGAG